MTTIFVCSLLKTSPRDFVIEQVFLNRDDAIDWAYGQTQQAIRCNRPMEWRRVEAHDITDSIGDIVWGPDCVVDDEKGAQ